jgi:hypothetical protein
LANAGVAPPNFATSVGQFRALIGDTDAIGIDAGIGEYVWFSDEEINAFLTMYSDNVKSAAARALYTIAGSQALLLKKWSADDLHVDGAAIAEALRKQAKDLQDEVAAGDAAVDFWAISYPGQTTEYVPEGFPVPLPLRGREGDSGYGGDEGETWYIDEDGYIVNG